MNTAAIARVCHEANRAYCLGLGDDSQLPWEHAPEWQVASAIHGVEFHHKNLALGLSVPDSASHDSWLREKKAAGWSYGPVKDADKKQHPCYVPYEDLPLDQRLKDTLFAAVVKSLWPLSASDTPTT